MTKAFFRFLSFPFFFPFFFLNAGPKYLDIHWFRDNGVRVARALQWLSRKSHSFRVKDNQDPLCLCIINTRRISLGHSQKLWNASFVSLETCDYRYQSLQKPYEHERLKSGPTRRGIPTISPARITLQQMLFVLHWYEAVARTRDRGEIFSGLFDGLPLSRQRLRKI